MKTPSLPDINLPTINVPDIPISKPSVVDNFDLPSVAGLANTVVDAVSGIADQIPTISRSRSRRKRQLLSAVAALAGLAVVASVVRRRRQQAQVDRAVHDGLAEAA